MTSLIRRYYHSFNTCSACHMLLIHPVIFCFLWFCRENFKQVLERYRRDRRDAIQRHVGINSNMLHNDQCNYYRSYTRLLDSDTDCDISHFAYASDESVFTHRSKY